VRTSPEDTRDPTPCRPSAVDDAPFAPHLDRLERCCTSAQGIVTRELRPALGEVVDRRQADVDLVTMAAACGKRLRDLQVIAGGVRAPAPLAEQALRVERALAIYVQAAASLQAAAVAADEDERHALVEDVIAFIGFADRLHGDALSSLAVLRP
jgi:hypothetical protein